MNPKQDDLYTDSIYIVTHQLKTPISAAKSLIEMVQQVGPLNQQQMHFSERALVNLERMEKLISDLLDYTRFHAKGEFQPEICDLRTLVLDALELAREVAEPRSITIDAEIGTEPLMIMADARLLTEVVNNLLSNGIKYNQDGGTLRVKITDDADSIQVDVSDTGIGIPERDIDHVFDQFFRSKNSANNAEGSGLGLAIAQMIVKQHQGHLWVESVEGEGSTFSFTLPHLGDIEIAESLPAQTSADDTGAE